MLSAAQYKVSTRVNCQFALLQLQLRTVHSKYIDYRFYAKCSAVQSQHSSQLSVCTSTITT